MEVDSTKELSKCKRKKLLKTQNKVVDTIIMGGEKFFRNSYFGIDDKVSSFVIGCYGDRFFNASEREASAFRKKQEVLIKKGLSPIQKVMTSLGYKLELE